jgi:aminoglycoside/choline kinase family phosphotransferase
MEINGLLKQKIESFLKKNHVPISLNSDNFILLAGGGSDRSYYRLLSNESSLVLMVSPSDKKEVTAFIDVGKFLFHTGIGVPEIIDVDEEGLMLLLEDMGDDSLYNILCHKKNEIDICGYYKKVLLFLAEMQIRPFLGLVQCNYLKNRSFGYEEFRWETDYFRERFLKQFCSLSLPKEVLLEEEFNCLASCLDKEPKYFMHRDFQSQNIHFKNGQVKAIDFQTATKGLLQYDLASVLKDAYFVIDQKMRAELIDYYLDILNKKWGMKIDHKEFIKTFHLVGMQRNMQALGAFAFLGLQKGKKGFFRHIPAALAYLEEALLLFPDYPVLKDTVSEAAESIQKNTLLKN